MRCILGIDSGGSKCDALLVRDDGILLGWGRSDPVRQGRTDTGSGRSWPAVYSALTKAIGTTRCDELHVVNYSERFSLDFLREKLCANIHRHAALEHTAARALVGVEDGIVALAGTGALVHGRTRDGQQKTLDGLGPLLGDHGGGFHIGLLGVRAAGQSGWHPRRGTSLAEAIYQECGGLGDRSSFSLVKYMLVERDRSEIASLARIVDQEANKGDRIAVEILQQAAAELAATVYDVVDTLGMAEDEYPFVGTGSVALRSEIFWNHCCKLVQEFAPRFRPMTTRLPPVAGVVLAVLGALDGVEADKARKVLLDETAEFFVRVAV